MISWKKLFVFTVCFLFSLNLSADNYSIPFTSKRNIDSNNISLEKIYVHIDKSYYYTDENIWFKIYLVDGVSHHPSLNSLIAYLDIIDPNNKIVETKVIKINDGFGSGNIFLPFDLIKGKYTLRAYTNHMRNFKSSAFFKKQIFINSKYESTDISSSQHVNLVSQLMLDLQFFPEGGQIVNGFNNRIGFKAVDENGLGVNLKGEIVDENHELVVEFSSSKFGMGLFHLTPKEGKVYKANVIYNDKLVSFKLPKTLNNGVIIKIVEYEDHYRANIESSFKSGMKDYKFIVKQSAGIVFNSKIIKNSYKSVAKIPKEILKSGIVQFTLHDSQNKPVAERLSFYEMDVESPNSIISFIKQEYKINEQIEIELLLDNILEKKKINNANISMAVTEFSIDAVDKYDLDIKTFLLLTSEIKGSIERPSYYFHSKDDNRKKNLDILMLTQGWRKYEEPSIDEIKLNYLFEKGITIGGEVKSVTFPDWGIRSEVSLAYKNSQEQGYDATITDENGRFWFRDLNFVDSTSVILKAKNLGHEKKIFIQLDSVLPPKISSLVSIENGINPEINTFNSRSSIGNKKHKGIILKEDDLIELDEVEVKSRKEEEKVDEHKNERRLLYKNASQTMDFTELRTVTPHLNVLDALQGRVPGLSFRGDGIFIRGASSFDISSNRALLLIDGMPVNYDSTTISTLTISEVDFVDVLKGPRAAIYGAHAANGVIAVYTRNATNYDKEILDNSSIKYTYPGMSYSKKFYIPKFESKRNLKYYQKTQYWNPNISIAKDNGAKLSFFSGETQAKYKIVVEGISLNGNIIQAEAIIQVK